MAGLAKLDLGLAVLQILGAQNHAQGNAQQISVVEFDPQTSKGNGFTFNNCEARELFDAIKRALILYRHKRVWMELIKKVMRLDFSWEASAKEYLKLYNFLTRLN